jgi:hypothetical protein
MLRRSFLSLLAGVALLAACGGDGGPTGPNPTTTVITGGYTLQTVNGNTLPWRFLVVGNDWAEITSGSGNINSDGTYSMRVNYRVRESGQESTFSETSTGTYVRNGNAITFTDAADGSRASGTVSGNQISVTDEDGIVYVFRRN